MSRQALALARATVEICNEVLGAFTCGQLPDETTGDEKTILDESVRGVADKIRGKVVVSRALKHGRGVVFELPSGEKLIRLTAQIFVLNGWIYMAQAVNTDGLPAADVKTFFAGVKIAGQMD